ncbi:hypothetical protein DFJ74DRAFT_765083 [Hyaloraphidium curvatum]|nr:hypothetical protein DFJ74DRAFT_765083 [Hyaloraphidium curvatum]
MPGNPGSWWACDAYIDFRDRELAWLRSLSPDALARLATKDGEFEPHTMLTSGEVGLLLAGVKPAVLFACFSWPHDGSGRGSYSGHLAQAVLAPWFEQWDLEARGFRYRQITGACTEVVLHNGRHPRAGAVRAAFASDRAVVPWAEIGKALGYPSAALGHDNARIRYLAKDPSPFGPMAEEDENGAVMLEYDADSWDAEAVGKHFRTCADAVHPLGLELVLDARECGSWELEDVQELEPAAAAPPASRGKAAGREYDVLVPDEENYEEEGTGDEMEGETEEDHDEDIY